MNYKPRKTVELDLDRDLVTAAEAAGIDPQQAAEQGLAHALKARRIEEWLEENRAAVESSNRFVEEQGLPLAQYRLI